jgi:hypothetical protein
MIRPAHGAAMKRWAGLDHGQRGEIGSDGVGVDGTASSRACALEWCWTWALACGA